MSSAEGIDPFREEFDLFGEGIDLFRFGAAADELATVVATDHSGYTIAGPSGDKPCHRPPSPASLTFHWSPSCSSTIGCQYPQCAYLTTKTTYA